MITIDETICFECSSPAVYQHHVVPKSKGGTKTIPLCHACHSKVHGRNMLHPNLIKNALARKKQEGKVYGSIPYGKKRGPDGETIIPNEEEQKAIERVRELRIEGLSLNQIKERLIKENFKHRSKWTYPVIKWIVDSLGIETPKHLQGSRFGYIMMNGKEIENEPEQKIIQKMKELRLQSLSYRQISDELNKLKIPTRRGKPWIMMSVRVILVREKLPIPSRTWHGKPIYGQSE